MKDFIKGFLKSYTISIVTCILLSALEYVCRADVLESLVRGQMLSIQLTILAINIPTLCLVISELNKISQSIKDDGMEYLRSSFKISTLEQIGYIILGIASLVILDGHKQDDCILHNSFHVAFCLSWLGMSVATMWDTFKSVLVISKYEKLTKI